MSNSTAIPSLKALFPNYAYPFPAELIQATETLTAQSSVGLPLNSTEEAARSMICGLLAFEKLEFKLQEVMPGQVPQIKKTPLPPQKFKELTNVFRQHLFPGEPALPSPSKRRSPRKQASAPIDMSPRKRKRMDDVMTVSPVKSTNSQSTSLYFQPQEMDPDSDMDEPEKKPRGRAARGSKTTVKKATATKGKLAKNRGPGKSDIKEICSYIGVSPQVQDAIIKTYGLYHTLVNDRWGLLAGIIVIIVSKAEPRIIEVGGTYSFYRKLADSANSRGFGVVLDQQKIEDWIKWASHIVNDQTWIKKVTRPDVKPIDLVSTGTKYSSGIGNMVSISNNKINQYFVLIQFF